MIFPKKDKDKNKDSLNKTEDKEDIDLEKSFARFVKDKEDKLKKVNILSLFQLIVLVFSIGLVAYYSLSFVRPVVKPNKLEIKARFKYIENSGRVVVKYKIEEDVIKIDPKLVENTAKKNKKRLIDKPIYVELIKDNTDTWEINKVSSKKIKRNPNVDKKKYRYEKVYPISKNKVQMKNVQRVVDDNFLEVKNISKNESIYYKVTLMKRLNDYKIFSVKSINYYTDNDNLDNKKTDIQDKSVTNKGGLGSNIFNRFNKDNENNKGNEDKNVDNADLSEELLDMIEKDYE